MALIVEPRLVKITTRTEIDVRRNLPHAHLKRIGAWVFLDHFGPTKQVDGMVVAAHPHTGLQTVTWPFAGRIDHRDSIGSEQLIEPGQLNLMTAGSGIAHSEVSLVGPDELHAVQLWLALPEANRHMAPEFEHVGNPPKLDMGKLKATVFIGELNGVRSPATIYSPLVGAELRLNGSQTLSLRDDWEYGVLVVSGALKINGEAIEANNLAYYPVGMSTLELEGDDFHGILIGGEPFTEQIVMWWNFIGRTGEEITQMRDEWNGRSSIYNEVHDSIGGWIPAPELPNVTLRAR
jgi:redox-sensitive bicupin YhaK (pirin superfamily)